ncbi:DnaJ domain-containing protein [Mitsuaria sp. WAJ17]|uniref:DnaJ C-terminal domain-containing protein n=1 Tax=Mitsuaria sp. WAJ17 TaxID=2761452 RepID=UPI001601EA79|nr:DnaJ C-terminal domain-containing protein [Mitsuaria sp. WAJ17]MBB2487481.1 DnaJ domain-containing protein [Mitsuaria sp. WAJ17]
MDYKDYYATLGVARTATADEIKRAYRKLARKYHPDVSKVQDAEARFKELGEAYEVLKDAEKRAAYDAVGQDWDRQQQRAPGRAERTWDEDFEFHGAHQDGSFAEHSDFFDALFGSAAGPGRRRGNRSGQVRGEDHHARVRVRLEDLYQGADRVLTLRSPARNAEGQMLMTERRVDVHIPKGVQAGQQLRLKGQGGPGGEGAPAGDLYLEVELEPHPRYRLAGRDVHFDLPLAPWEVALGATVTTATPGGPVALKVPRGSQPGHKLRLAGRGLPGDPPGDLYAEVILRMPRVDSPAVEQAWRDLERACAQAGHRPSTE